MKPLYALTALTLIAITAPQAFASGASVPNPDATPYEDSFDPNNTSPSSPFRLQFGDVYAGEGRTELTPIFDDYPNDKYAKFDHCSYNAMKATADFDFEYMDYQQSFDYPGSKYLTETNHYKIYNLIFGPDSTDCDWNKDGMTDQVKIDSGNLRQNRRYLVLDRISDKADSINARLIVTSPGFKSRLASGRDYLETFVNASFSGCVDEDGNNVNTFLPTENNTMDLGANIQALRKRTNRVLTKCTLKVTSAKAGGDIVKVGQVQIKNLSERPMFWNVIDSQPDSLIVSSADGINSGDYSANYKRGGQAASTDKEKLALDAGRAFKEFIVNDYGDLLYDLSDRKVPREEAIQTVKAFFETHRAQMQGWFESLDNNWKDVALMNKVTLLINLKDMYVSIGQIEGDILASQTVNLDRVIKSLGK